MFHTVSPTSKMEWGMLTLASVALPVLGVNCVTVFSRPRKMSARILSHDMAVVRPLSCARQSMPKATGPFFSSIFVASLARSASSSVHSLRSVAERLVSPMVSDGAERVMLALPVGVLT